MRIPSGLNDGNLYRRSHEKSVQQTQYRRLLRLVLALILVLVAMKQAGRPALYSIFFSEPSTLLPVPARPANQSLDDYADFAKSADSADSDGDLADQALQRPRRELADFASVDDGVTWKPEDGPAFYRLLEGSPVQALAQQQPRRVGVISLLQQPDVYLRTPIVLNAKVARVTKLEAKRNDFGITHYWEIWLQPLDGSNHPVAFYTRQVPNPIGQLDGTAYVSEGPVVDIAGIYLKRLAFQSAAGSDLAPAIVGRFQSTAPPPAGFSTVPDEQPQLSPWYLVLASAVVGVGGAMVISAMAAISSRRMRQARLASQQVPKQLFTSLVTDLEARKQP